jgi:hypothetical protein
MPWWRECRNRSAFKHRAAVTTRYGQSQWGRTGKSWLETMAAIMIAVPMLPPSHEYHLMLSFLSARPLSFDNAGTDTSASVVSLMVVSADNPPLLTFVLLAS